MSCSVVVPSRAVRSVPSSWLVAWDKGMGVWRARLTWTIVWMVHHTLCCVCVCVCVCVVEGRRKGDSDLS